MGRKRSAADDIMDITAALPWWAGVLLAVVSYVWLHQLASAPTGASPGDVAAVGTAIQTTMVRTFASLGQIILPSLFLIGSLMSWIGVRRRYNLHDNARVGGKAAISQMGWKDFERLTHEIFRRQGYAVVESSRGPDGGVDLRLSKDGLRAIVQCKHWNKDVGVKVVRELYGVKTQSRADVAIVVSSAGFTGEAKAFAASTGVVLLDGSSLVKEVGYASSPMPETPPSSIAARPTAATCPVCSSAMIIRTASRGANAGKQFLGCTSFPKCRGTRRL
jgi:restriction system protein